MKILKKGIPNPEWVGKIVACGSCKCRVKLEQGDEVEFTSNQRDGDFYLIKCPTLGCKGSIIF